MFFPVTMSAGVPPSSGQALQAAAPPLVIPEGATLIPQRLKLANGAIVEADGRIPEELVATHPWAYRNNNGTVSCVMCHHKGGHIIGRRQDLSKHAENKGHRAYLEAMQAKLADNMTNDVASEDGHSVTETEARYFEEARGQISAVFQFLPWDPFGWPEYSCEFLSRRAIVLSRLAGTTWSQNRRVRRLVSHIYRNDLVVCSFVMRRVFCQTRYRALLNSGPRRQSLRLARRRDEVNAVRAAADATSQAGDEVDLITTPGEIFCFLSP